MQSQTARECALWRMHRKEVQTVFFHLLLNGRLPAGEQGPEALARDYEVDPDSLYQPFYLRYRLRVAPWEDFSAAVTADRTVSASIAACFSVFPGVWELSVDSNVRLVLLSFQGVNQAYRTCQSSCRQLISRLREAELDCVCQLGTASALPALSAQLQELLQTGRDQVYIDGHLIAGSVRRQRVESPPQPNVQRILTLMDCGMYQEAVDAAKSFFAHPEVRPQLNRGFLENYKYQFLDGLRNLSAVRRMDRNILSAIPQPAVDLASTTVQDFLVLLELICRQLALQKPARRDTRDLFEVAKSYILDNLAAPLDRTAVAGRCFVSADYMDRVFRRMGGTTVTGYILEARIGLAKELLCSSSASVSDIAVKAGFLNFSHFSRVFKAKTGMTPVQYRKSSQLAAPL